MDLDERSKMAAESGRAVSAWQLQGGHPGDLQGRPESLLLGSHLGAGEKKEEEKGGGQKEALQKRKGIKQRVWRVVWANPEGLGQERRGVSPKSGDGEKGFSREPAPPGGVLAASRREDF